MIRSFLRATAVVACLPSSAFAQSPVPAPAAVSAVATAAPDAPASVAVAPLLPTGTGVDFEILDPLSSKTSMIDQFFAIRLIDPIRVGGRIVVPAGTSGMGQVVHAAKAGWGGKAGELVLAARYLDFNGVRIPLRRFKLGMSATGNDRREEAFAVSMAVPLAGFIMNGGEMIIPAHTRANAIVSADTALPARPEPAAPPTP